MNGLNANLSRAQVLLEQGRLDLAENHLRLALAEDPDHGLAHSWLALCLSDREKHTEATDEARRGVALLPEDGYAHFVLARVLSNRDMDREAMEAAREAIALKPGESQHWGMLAALLLAEKRYREGLEAAEKGLEADAEDEWCLNLRAMALTNLGRKEEATATIEGALARDPDNAMSHANMGWTRLRQGRPKDALEHFREALRLEPSLDWARAGMVEAMKARYVLYRLMLGYFLWMGSLPSRVQWAVIIGGMLGYNFLRRLARSNPDLAPYIWPVVIAYLVFVAASWLSYPLSNLMLRLNRFGRLALSRQQTIAANALGVALVLPLASLVAMAATGESWFGFAALMTGATVPPVAAAGQARAGAPRTVMVVYAGVVALLAAFVLAGSALPGGLGTLAGALAGPTVLASILSLVVANVMNTTRAGAKS